LVWQTDLEKEIGGVEYSLGSIPAGGFVALPQLAPMEVMEGKVETPARPNAADQCAGQDYRGLRRAALQLFAGRGLAVHRLESRPAMSEAESTQTVGYVEEKSPAAEAGVLVGDKILSVAWAPGDALPGHGGG